MPLYNIPVTYQTADRPAILAALKWNYNVATDDEALAALGNTTRQNLIDIVTRHRREVAIAAAEASLPPPIVVT
jgi:hypothetical protein